jgi:glutamate racemase
MPITPSREAPPPTPPARSRHPSAAKASGAAARSQGSAGQVKLNLAHPHQSMPPAAVQPQPASSAGPAVPATALANNGADYVDKLTALIASPGWEKLRAEVRSEVLAYLNDHHDMLPLFVAIRDAVESSKKAGFEHWLQSQGEPLKTFYAKVYQPMLAAPLIDLHPLTPEQRIDDWLKKHRTADEICHALNGKEIELGTLPPRQQQYLIDRAFNLDKQDSRNLIPFSRVGDLVQLVQRDHHKLQRVVAERLMNCAINSQRRPEGEGTLDDPHNQARACALHALDAMCGNDRELGQLVAQMLPEEAVRFAEALGNGSGLDSAAMSEKRHQVLTAVNSLVGSPSAGSPAITALVYVLWDQISPEDLLQRTPQLAHSLAVAVADRWDPKTPPVKRLEKLLTSPAGAKLMCTGPSDWKAAVHEAVRYNSELTADMLARDGGEPERNPDVAAAVAAQLVAAARGGQVTAANADENAGEELLASALQTGSGHKLLFDERVSAADRSAVLRVMLADHGQKLKRADFEHTKDAWQLRWIAEPFAAQALATFPDGDFPSLPPIARKNLIGFNLGIPPSTAGTSVTAKDIEETWKALADGKIPPFLTENDFYQDNAAVEKIAKNFVNTTGFGVEHAMLFSGGPVALPLFHGHKLDGSEFYVDQDGNVLSDSFPQDQNYRVSFRTAFQNFLDENPLPEGTLYFQGQGFKTWPPGHRETPAARDTSKKVWHGVAQGATAVAIIAAFVGTNGLAGAVLGYLGMMGAGYLAVEEGRHLIWLDAHGHDVNPFTNPDQAIIASWLGMVANAAGPFAAVGGLGFRGLAAAGALSAPTAKLAIRALELGAKGANAIALGNAFLEMALHPERVTPSDLLQTAFFTWMSLRHAPQRPTVATPRPPVTPIAPPSALPTARLLPPAPTSATPGFNKLNEKVTLPAKPVTPPTKLPSIRPRPASGPAPFTFYGNAPFAFPPAPMSLLSKPAGQSGGTPAPADALVPAGSSRPAGSNSQTAAVDPKTQRMAGAAPPGSSDADAGGAAANPPSGGGAGQPPPNDPHNYSHIEQGNVGQVMDALNAHNAGPRVPAGPELSPAESGALSKFAGHFDLDGMGPSILADVASLPVPERARFIANADHLSAQDRQQISAFASSLPRTYGGKIKARFIEFLVYLSPEQRFKAIGLVQRLAKHEYSGRLNAPHNPGVERLTPQERDRIRQDLDDLFQISGKVPAPLADFVDVYPRVSPVDDVTMVVKSRGIAAMRASDGVRLGAESIARLVKKSARAAAGKPATLRVLIATGYSVTEQHGAPLPETDGPPGAGLLGHDLQQLSNGLPAKGLNVRIEVTYVTDRANAPVQKAVNERLGLKDAEIHVFDALHGPEADTAAKKLLDDIEPDVVLFTERPGQTHEGEFRNMRGLSVKDINPPLDALLRIAGKSARPITTIAVGDGGNEAGMGGVNLYMPPNILNLRNVPTFATPDIYSIDSVGQPVTASVSNWGAQALGGAVLGQFGMLDAMHTGQQVRVAITAAGEAGAVDGVTRLKPGEVDANGQLSGVDGLSIEAHVGQHSLLRAALADPSKVSTQPQLEPIILILFDSSNGGMIAGKTIERIIREKTGHPVQLIIVADHGNAPYGARSGPQVTALTRGALQTAEKLSGEVGGVGELVMACNTACAEGQAKYYGQGPMEILDLIEVTSRAMIKDGGKKPVIIATEGTIRSKAYPREVKKDSGGSVKISKAQTLAAPEWATMVNYMLHESRDPAVKTAVDASIKQIVDKIPPDATSLWLNCTHYPELTSRIRQQLNIRAAGLEAQATKMEIGGERSDEANRLLSDAGKLRALRIFDPMEYQADAVIKQRGLTELPPDQRGKVGRENTPPPVIVTSGDARTVYDSARALMGRTDVRVVDIKQFGPETDIDKIPGVVSAPQVVDWREALAEAMRLREAQGLHDDPTTRRIYDNILSKAVPPDIVDPSAAPAAP